MHDDTRRRVKPWLFDQPAIRCRGLAWQPVAEHLGSAFALDDAGRDLVTEAQAGALQVTADQLMTWSLANLADQPRPGREQLSDEVTVFQGDSAFVASHVLGLELLLDVRSDHGAIVAVPNRRVLLVHVIRDLSVVDAFGPMLQAAQLLWEDARDAVSDQLFWWRDGRLERVPVPSAGNGHSGATPEDFRRLLRRLPPPHHGRV